MLQSGNDFNSTYIQVLKMLAVKMQLAYLGDLDTTGIEMADRVTAYLGAQHATALTAIQTPGQVAQWLAGYGKAAKGNRIRTTSKLRHQVWKEEAYLLVVNQQFVEQEQLIDSYEKLIPEWLGKARQNVR
ncbi:DUF2220 family protein [Lentilactobacillus farraginis]|uniref:DUF2220 family protein n=1 Tax=Lentilactobacillus farraginis TaxID=390841 RepID=UPI002286F698|nr:DUF2220 family protein [Lentilactobacillus farraginis]